MTSGQTQLVVRGSLIVVVLAAGCMSQGSRPRVQGQVTFQGQPVGGQTLEEKIVNACHGR